MEAEGVEEGEQEQKAYNTKNYNNQDVVHLHVHLLQWEPCGGGGGGQEAGVRRGGIETGWRRLHGGQVGDFRHDGKP